MGTRLRREDGERSFKTWRNLQSRLLLRSHYLAGSGMRFLVVELQQFYCWDRVDGVDNLGGEVCGGHRGGADGHRVGEGGGGGGDGGVC